MKELQHTVSYTEWDSIKELSPQLNQMYALAKEAALNAHAPYSNFRVGAALLLDNGEMISGSNQENAAYPSGICAERVAVFYASAKYPNAKMNTIVVCTLDGPENSVPVSPCGACRQVLIEYQHKQKSPLEIYLVSNSGKCQLFKSAAALLPFSFSADNLQ